MDQQVSAVVQEINSRNYHKASVLITGLMRQTRSKLGSALSPGQAHEASLAAVDQPATLSSLEQGRMRYQAGDWQGSLDSFTAAQAGVSRLELAVSPEERRLQDEAEASRQNSPMGFHSAARSAMKAGHLSESIEYLKREIAMIRAAYAPPGSGIAMQHAYTMMGLVYIAQNDIQTANKALDASLKGVPVGAFGPYASPSMALARALLIKGQNEAVLAYFDKCDQIGWSKSDQLGAWRAAVRSGNVPDFPKVTLAY